MNLYKPTTVYQSFVNKMLSPEKRQCVMLEKLYIGIGTDIFYLKVKN